MSGAFHLAQQRLTWVQPEDLLPHQLVQGRAEGVDVADVEDRWRRAGGTADAPVSGASDKPATAELRELARELLAELDSRTPAWTPPVIPIWLNAYRPSITKPMWLTEE